MGYIRHHAIVVTGSYERWPERAHGVAVGLFGEAGVSALSPGGALNGYRSFCVWPDGSKEGWDESDVGDARRAQFLAWLNAQAHEDGSQPLAWVEVQYGDDEHETKVVASRDDVVKADPRWVAEAPALSPGARVEGKAP